MLHNLGTINRNAYVKEKYWRITCVPNIPNQDPVEAELLASARQGDAQVFSELTEPYRRELRIHCYRILGSWQEAEDLVQETMLRAWKRLDSYEGRASFRAWLYKIATNACLDALDQRRSRRLLPFTSLPASNPQSAIQPPSPELTWLEPFPDEWLGDRSTLSPEARYSESESVSLAFLSALQALPPRQRAVLILRDVLDFSTNETAEVLELTLSSVNSALHRARVTLENRYHGGGPESSTISPDDERTQFLLDHFVQAWQRADVEGLVALLKEDATFAMPPSPSWYQGPAAIGSFAAATIFGDDGMFSGKAAGRWRLIRTNANAAPAFAIYQRTEANQYQAFGILVLEIDAGKLTQLVSFIDPSLSTHFGLPEMLD
jgi:RNA polymerase sigma-70 factor, ECF subfamily